jgi:hypothetical protein
MSEGLPASNAAEAAREAHVVREEIQILREEIRALRDEARTLQETLKVYSAIVECVCSSRLTRAGWL